MQISTLKKICREMLFTPFIAFTTPFPSKIFYIEPTIYQYTCRALDQKATTFERYLRVQADI